MQSFFDDFICEEKPDAEISRYFKPDFCTEEHVTSNTVNENWKINDHRNKEN